MEQDKQYSSHNSFLIMHLKSTITDINFIIILKTTYTYLDIIAKILDLSRLT